MENEYYWSLHRHEINLDLVHSEHYKQTGFIKWKLQLVIFAAYFPIS